MASTTSIASASPRTRSGAPTHHARGDSTFGRVFIGPMPENVVAHTEAEVKKHKTEGLLSLSFDSDETPDKSDDVSKIIKAHALHFFLHHGGKKEDWGEEQEQNIADEMLKRWKSSEWSHIWSHRHKAKKELGQTNHWVGGSFEIGRLLGVDIFRGVPIDEITKAGRSSTSGAQSTAAASKTGTEADQQTFATAPSRFSVNGELAAASGSGNGIHDGPSSTPATSSTRLIPSLSKQTDAIGTPGPSVQRTPPSLLRGKSDIDPKGKGKQKMVRYASNTPPQPVHPKQVLERAGSALEATSSAAASLSPPLVVSDELQWGEVVLRDRMLVRVLYTRCETLSPQFNESINRTTRDLHYEDWAEFLVAWRRDSLEIYEDHSFPGKEMFSKHKHLSYVIPLKSSRTHLSLYSFVDLSFCLTCPPTTTRLNASSSRWIFSRAKEGTNIFIFKLRSRSRAYDWFWLLWRHMGGQLPATLDIRNPQLNTKVTVDIPKDYALDSKKLYSMFRRENIISLCMDSLQAVPRWYHLVERELEKGKALQLCWRVDSNVDWIWLDDDVYGASRDWSVLCGLAFKQAMRPPILEIRLANHAPTHFHLKDGTHIDEPPSIEGYLERVKPGSQIKQLLYLTTHNGNIFITHTYHAYPPAPPGIALPLDLDSYVQDLHHAEVLRGSRQILHATGVCDLRSIIAVRRAFHVTPLPAHDVKETVGPEDPAWFGVWSQTEYRTLDDDEDEGGSHDKPGIRLRRAFELLLNTGNVVRFEAHSCRVALEWIDRLRALIAFWKHRHRIDAKEEVELAQGFRPRITPLTRLNQNEEESAPDPPPDFSAQYPAMNSLYNMCILDGCKPIVKGGKVYTRKGYRGQYKLVQLFLVAGNLIQFRIGPRTTLHKAMRKKISLIDAYVCSGYFAALTLPSGQFRPNAEPAPRRYQDGLETDDRDEDMILTVWFRSYLEEVARDQDPTTAALKSIATTPPLSAKRRTFVIRTRSKVERDAWCWALNSEIEKIVRAQREREERIRDSGNLVELA